MYASRTYFFTWTGLRHAVPLNLHTHPHSFTVTLDLENFKCRNYYSLLIKFKYEKPKNGPRLRTNLIWKITVFQKPFMLPIRVCSEPYLRSFQYKGLNFILFTGEILLKIDYIPSPNCSFCRDTKETRKPCIIYLSLFVLFLDGCYRQHFE